MIGSLAAQPITINSADSTLRIPRVFHHPKAVFLQGYPQDIDLIVDYPADSIQSVLLFIRFNDSPGYQEIPMVFERERHRYRFIPAETPADSIEYYFLVTVLGKSIHAAPLNENGNLVPVKRILIDPQIYYRNRNLFKK